MTVWTLLAKTPRHIRELLFVAVTGACSIATFFALAVPLGMDTNSHRHLYEWICYGVWLGLLARFYVWTRPRQLVSIAALQSIALIPTLIWMFDFKGAALISPERILITLFSYNVLVALPAAYGLFYFSWILDADKKALGARSRAIEIPLTPFLSGSIVGDRSRDREIYN